MAVAALNAQFSAQGIHVGGLEDVDEDDEWDSEDYGVAGFIPMMRLSRSFEDHESFASSTRVRKRDEHRVLG